jgi:cysteine desulfurase
MTQRIYLDNAATTPARPEVVEAMLPHFTRNGYNPSSLHAEGRAARAALDDARDRVARALGADRKEVIFTGSGSEADNLAVLGVARALRARGRHAISTVIEHHAILHPLDALRAEGWDVTLLPVSPDGLLDPQAFAAALRPDTVLASIAYANNEIGTVQPIRELATIARGAGVLLHTDAVQAAAYLPLDVADLGVDLLSISAHKFYGPKGVGALYVRAGTELEPLVVGGSQEFAKRAGTENVAGIVGMAVALEYVAAGRASIGSRVAALRDAFEAAVLERVPGTRVNGRGAPRLPNNANLSFTGVRSEHVLIRLDIEGIAVSAGSACTSGALEPSHVIAALGLPPEWMSGVIRFSLGESTTAGEIDRVLEVLPRAIEELREFSPIPA